MGSNKKQRPAGAAAPPASAAEPTSQASIVKRFMDRPKVTAIVAIGGAFLALLNYGKEVGETWGKLFPKPDVEEIGKQLASDSGELRLAALSRLKDYESRKSNDMEQALAVLQESISRRASRAFKSGDSTAASSRETTMALQALSHLLKFADEHQMKLQRPRLVNLNLARLDLGGLYMRGTDWEDVDAQDARLASTDLRGARLDGVQLALADATKVDLSDATLKRVCLESAVLDEAKLSRAHIDQSDMNAASLRQADLTAAVVRESRMNGAKLSGAVLSGADLSTALEWLPRQAQEVGRRDANTAFPAAFRQLRLGVCG